CRQDPISQRAIVHDEVNEAKCKNLNGHAGEKKLALSAGTEFRIEWSRAEKDGVAVWPFSGRSPLVAGAGNQPSVVEQIRTLVEGFALFNPHATFTLDWFGQVTTWNATNPVWEKWTPRKPTSPHWYELRHLERLIGAYATHDRDAGVDRLVSDFVR